MHDLGTLPVARSVFSRYVGLMGRRTPDRLFLVLPKCRSVHTWFMRTPIDIAYLNGYGTVLELAERAGPWGVHPGPKGTQYVLELPPGYARGIGLARGDSVTWRTGNQLRSRGPGPMSPASPEADPAR